jgi:hypothetical protein
VPHEDMGLRNREEGEELTDVLVGAHKMFLEVQMIREVGMPEPALALLVRST